MKIISSDNSGSQALDLFRNQVQDHIQEIRRQQSLLDSQVIETSDRFRQIGYDFTSIRDASQNGGGVQTARGVQQVDANGFQGFEATRPRFARGELNYTSTRDFDPDAYRAANPDVAQLIPYDWTLNHYLAHGIAEGRRTS
jgi:hypothetical protein